MEASLAVMEFIPWKPCKDCNGNPRYSGALDCLEDVSAAYNVPASAIHKLGKSFPESPAAERARFLARRSVGKCPHKAASLLSAYLRSRKTELAVWPPTPYGLPDVLRFNGCAIDGSRILHCLPCKISMRYPAQSYAHYMVRLVESSLPRKSLQHITLLIDTRPRQGCDNNNLFKMWRHLVFLKRFFQQYCPERLARVVVYPVSAGELLAWKTVRSVLPASTEHKVVLLAGRQDGPLPKQLSEYISTQEHSPELK